MTIQKQIQEMFAKIDKNAAIYQFAIDIDSPELAEEKRKVGLELFDQLAALEVIRDEMIMAERRERDAS